MRKISATGLALIKREEGVRLRTYRDVVGVRTIGYGHTGPDVTDGRQIGEREAEQILQQDLARFEAVVHEAVRVPLNENEFAALVSLTFNIGAKAFRESTALRRLNAGDRAGAAEAILRFERAGGQVQPILQRRRRAERELFLTPVAGADPPAPPKPAPPAPPPAPPQQQPPPPPAKAAPAPPAAKKPAAKAAPRKPLAKSRTIWGTIGGALATIGSMAASAAQAVGAGITVHPGVSLALGAAVLLALAFIFYARVDDWLRRRR